MNSRPTPPTGTRATLATALVALGVLAGTWTLRPLLAPGPWLTTVTLTVVVVGAAVAVARALSRSVLAPTLWGVGAAALAVAALYSGPGRLTVPLPTLETLRTLRRVTEAGARAVVDGSIPLPPSRGTEMLVVVGALLVLVVADALAVSLGRAGPAGVALAGLWSVAVVFEASPGLASLLVGGTSFLLLLALTRPQRSRSQSVRDGGLVVATAAGVTVAAVAAGPLLTGVPGWGSVVLPSAWGNGPSASGPVEVSLDLDMRSSLGARSDRPLITYTLTGAAPGPLRLYTLTEFDGREWQRDTTTTSEAPATGALWPDEPGRSAAQTAEPGQDGVGRLVVEVGDLDQDRLPLPLEPRRVAVPGDWRYDAELDEVASGSAATTRGLAYEVVVAPRDLSAPTLQADSVAPLPAGSPYLELPATTFAADVADLAREVTAGAVTPYDQALALQTYLRDGSLFRYDTEVPAPRTDDAVWDFLTDRTGYCVQYATAMTVMARHLGLPTRMAVGFLPGRAAAGGRYAISGQLAHTWPEIWFEGAGWVRFEPTPAVQTGSPPTYADPAVTTQLEPDEEPAPGTAATPAPTTTAAPQAPGGGLGQGEVTVGATRIPLAAAAGGLAVLALATAAAVVVVRRRTAQAVPTGPEATWGRLRIALAERGVRWDEATTLRGAERAVLHAYGDDPPESVRRALHRLVAAAEAARYAPAPPVWDQDDLEGWAAEVLAGFDARPPAGAEPQLAGRAGR
ncbi:MAG: transglutaminase domain-containing protein [Actinotalea sp.]|nr:transglutaminase domain-containing protein [Actinotalea sp.]